MSHSLKTSCDRNFVVGQACRDKWILIAPRTARAIAFVIIALQISILAGIMSLEPDIHRRPEVGKITGIQIVNFSSLPAHQQTLGTDPGTILVRGEIKDSKLTVKLKVGDDLNGFDLLFYRWGPVRLGPAISGDLNLNAFIVAFSYPALRNLRINAMPW